MPAGDLRERVVFEQQLENDTSYGSVAGDWEAGFEVWARMKSIVRNFGSPEAVAAQRLTEVARVVFTVRYSSDTKLVTSAWRIRHKNSGTLYNIRAVTPDERNAYIDFLAEAGVAQ